MAFQFFDFARLGIGLLPFIIMLMGGIVILVAYVLQRLTADDIAEILLSAGTIWLIVIAVMVFVGLVCAGIQVREGFDSVKMADIEGLEKEVCALVASSDSYIMNDVGQPGQDNPAVLAAAKQKARGSAPITVCDLTSTQMEDRISRIENTLKNFTGPQLKKTYDTVIPCEEGFAGVEPASLSSRLKKIKDTIAAQKTGLLSPIQKKEADVKAGKLSECEKKKGANAAIAGGPPSSF
jgi:hypothetical protein